MYHPTGGRAGGERQVVVCGVSVALEATVQGRRGSRTRGRPVAAPAVTLVLEPTVSVANLLAIPAEVRLTYPREPSTGAALWNGLAGILWFRPP